MTLKSAGLDGRSPSCTLHGIGREWISLFASQALHVRLDFCDGHDCTSTRFENLDPSCRDFFVDLGFAERQRAAKLFDRHRPFEEARHAGKAPCRGWLIGHKILQNCPRT